MTSPSGIGPESRTRNSRPGTKPGFARPALHFRAPLFPHLCNGNNNSGLRKGKGLGSSCCVGGGVVSLWVSSSFARAFWDPPPGFPFGPSALPSVRDRDLVCLAPHCSRSVHVGGMNECANERTKEGMDQCQDLLPLVQLCKTAA